LAQRGNMILKGSANAMQLTEESRWESTTVQNLIRYRPSGTYFARFKIGGKLIRQSLETPVFSIAKQRLPDKIREYRARHESAKAFAGGKMTVGDAAEVYLQKVLASVSLKPRSKDYCEMMIDFIRRSWPSLFDTDVRKVTPRDCEVWLIGGLIIAGAPVIVKALFTAFGIDSSTVDVGAFQ
jgi:hypothetical protein